MTELFKGLPPQRVKPCHQCYQYELRNGKHRCKLNNEPTETARLKSNDCWQRSNKNRLAKLHSR